MKKIKIGIIAFVLLLSALLLASCNSVDVKNVYVNEDLHAIVEYTDGTTKDLGYVGKEVEVIPPKYTVTFLDADGNTLSVQKIYKGDAAAAPQAPEIPEKAFDRWDTAFTEVTENLTVRPVYIAAAQYTVTFIDETGATIKTETVIHGNAATAPEAPKRANTVFKEWSTAFDNVKGNLTVKAVYRAKESYTVTFKDYTGVTLGTASVKETDTAVAPVTPTREGYVFSGWSSSLENVCENKTVTATYTLKNAENVIDLSYTVKSDGAVEMTLSVVGTVKFAVLQASVTLPDGVTVEAPTGLSGAIVNLDGNTCRISYLTVTNTTAKTPILKLTFKPAAGKADVSVSVNVEKMVDQTTAPVSYTVIGETVKVK